MEGDNSNVYLNIPQGKLIGKEFKDWNDNIYHGFLSIPYAQPPVGELRLKAPVEAKPWNGTLNATKDLPTCVHLSKFNKIVGTEDCLYLNVYTANILKTSKLPVLVFIHGGGFIEGSGQMKTFGPDYIISEGLVIVSINFRISTIGSLSTNDQSILPGNFGLKDQVMALKWVQQNISYFGGDASNVTIMGQSAGAASVQLHMLSPMSAGLFHKVIIQSGSIFAIWGKGKKGTVKRAAEKLGINSDNEVNIVNQLMKVSAEELTNTVYARMIFPIKDILNDCAPVVEEQNNSPNFLLSKPLDIIKSGQFAKVPMLIGYNSEEGLFFEIIKQIMKTELDKLDVFDLKNNMPYDLRLQNQPLVREDFAKKVKDFYFNGKEPENAEETYLAKIKILSDLEMKYPIHKTIKEHLKASDAPIYFYEFDMETELNSLKNAIPYYKTFKGVTHAEELSYFFKKANTKVESNSIEEMCIKKVVKLWTNFIKTGNPTPFNDPLLNVNWLPVTGDKMNCLKIENDCLRMQENSYNEIKFWTNMYELYEE